MAKNTNKLFTYIGLGIVAAVAISAIKKAKASSNNNYNGNGSGNGFSPLQVNYQFPIVYNKYHPAVKEIQRALGFRGSDVDGIIGPQTLRAMQQHLPLFTATEIIRNQDDLQLVIDTINKIF